MIVIHEIFGLNENIRDIAERFASQGYAALAVDLFSTGNRVICMMRIMYGMLISPIKNGVVEDLQVVIDFLKTQPSVDPNRIGVMGFCMGGTYALQLACTENDIKAASVFYGMNPRPLEVVAQSCPVVGHYPEQDFTAKAARLLEPMLEKHNIPHDIKIYEGAKHSFFNDRGPNFHPDAAKDAWEKMLAFFNEHIG
ncbi:MAG: dienelactone hydrolase family protein [Anaerolineae bacterium]|nr:dienelactone hydrolase family protein [Anaerolineae bacterium]